MNRINTAAKRRRLEPNREPYWWKIGKGRFIGFRKTPTGGGSWVARLSKTQQRFADESELGF
jgi:hypothetical protein